MMTSEGRPRVTEADVRSLAAKLKGLHTLLTPGEQVLLQAALRRAAGYQETRVPELGAFWAVNFNPFTYLDAITASTSGGYETHSN